MSASELHERHLTAEEVVARVFPVHEGAVPVPLHLSVCPRCVSRVERLREAWLLDRGAVEGVMEEIPVTFWEEQSALVLGRVRDEAAAASSMASVACLPLRWKATVLRRPAIAAASLAAALLLVASVTFFHARPGSSPITARGTQVTQVTPGPATETGNRGGFANAADARDDELLRGVDQALTEEMPFRSLIPEEV